MAHNGELHSNGDLAKNGSSNHSPPAEACDEKPTLSPGKAYFKLWTYASPLDMFLRLFGTAAILAAGTTLPLMTIIFGSFVNEFNGWGTGSTSPEAFRAAVNKNALYLVYLFIGRFAMTYVGAMLYNATASKITRQIRLRYVDKVMHQPISYFDRHSTGSISTDLTADVNQIELGLGEKISLVFLGSSMIITAFTIALTKNWRLALACMTVVPWSVAITGTLASIDTKIEARVKAIYSEASTVVEEALSSIGNITALGASSKIVARFQSYVDRAMHNVAIRGGLWATVFGNMFFSTHAVYALCLYYGVKLVNEGKAKDGGTVMM
jgi:ATP-binding cassette, subfamily B (MDR/TAP), member 1